MDYLSDPIAQHIFMRFEAAVSENDFATAANECEALLAHFEATLGHDHSLTGLTRQALEGLRFKASAASN